MRVHNFTELENLLTILFIRCIPYISFLSRSEQEPVNEFKIFVALSAIKNAQLNFHQVKSNFPPRVRYRIGFLLFRSTCLSPSLESDFPEKKKKNSRVHYTCELRGRVTRYFSKRACILNFLPTRAFPLILSPWLWLYSTARCCCRTSMSSMWLSRAYVAAVEEYHFSLYTRVPRVVHCKPPPFSQPLARWIEKVSSSALSSF